jgi:hypothetical protein
MTFSGKGSPLDHAGIDAFTGVNTSIRLNLKLILLKQ